MRKSKWLLLTLCAVLIVLASGCDKLKSRDQMNQGVQAYRNNHYAEAVKHFKEAVTLDPTNQNAQLYLATSYMIQWVPGADSPDNQKNYEMAKQEFQKVLQKDPSNSLALASMAAMATIPRPAAVPSRSWRLLRMRASGISAGSKSIRKMPKRITISASLTMPRL